MEVLIGKQQEITEKLIIWEMIIYGHPGMEQVVRSRPLERNGLLL